MRFSSLSGFAISCLSLATTPLIRAESITTLQRRDPGKTIPLIIDNTNNAYQLNVTVGTPGQQQSLVLVFDDGTTWLNAANASYCHSSDCTSVYNINKSSSEVTVYNGFEISYGDGTSVSGDWVNDTIGLSEDANNYPISNVQFGVAYSTNTASGILGLGYNFTSTDLANQRNLPYLIHQQGYIDCVCYSLWLNDATSSHGRLIFGGVDTGKFQGNLATLPLHLGTYPTISLASVQTSQGNINTQITNVPLEVLPDAGDTLIMLPLNVTDPIFQQVGAVMDDAAGGAVIDCKAQNSSTSVGFTFAITNTTSTTISVPMSELVFSFNSTSCYFGIQPSTDVSILGVAFFRNAYIIYDFTHQQVSVAPANFYSTTDNVTAIGPHGVDASIDSGTGPLSSSAIATSTSTAAAATSTKAAAQTTASSSSPSATPHGLTTADKAGIGVGVPLGAMLILAAVGFFILQRRRRQQKASAAAAAAAAAEGSRHEKPELDADDVPPQRHMLKAGGGELRYEVDAPLSGGGGGGGAENQRHELKADGENARHELRSGDEHVRHELPSAQVVRHELSSDPTG